MKYAVAVKDGEQMVYATVEAEDEKSAKEAGLAYVKSEYDVSDKAKVDSVEESDVA